MKKVQSFSKLVELVRSNKVYSDGYLIAEDSINSSVYLYNDYNTIGKVVIEDICKLSRIYSNIGYYCTIHRGTLVLCVYLIEELCL